MQHHHIDRDNRHYRAHRNADVNVPPTGQPTLLTARELRRIVAEMLG